MQTSARIGVAVNVVYLAETGHFVCTIAAMHLRSWLWGQGVHYRQNKAIHGTYFGAIRCAEAFSMFKKLHLLLIAAMLFASCACSSSDTTTAKLTAGDRAQIFDDMGSHRRMITTDSAAAQKYFDQGLTWMYSFNHDEAVRSFHRAADLDPSAPMPWWGISLCHGPNYNDYIMTDERSAAAWDALQEAQARIDRAMPVERALINALAKRYANPWPEDRAHLDQAFADAMAQVWKRYPNDADVGTLYAESMMDLMPWKLYATDFTPAKNTPKIEATLERVMLLAPDHPGANHLYIHAVEPSADPDRGLVSARRLNDMMYASGHMLHMPSHIYVKTGRWDEAIRQNEKALASDEKYRKLSPDLGIQYFYMVHNGHMLAYAAMMNGREADAMKAARTMWSSIPEPALRQVGPFFDRWMSSVYDVQKRFGRWDDILAEPAPPEYLPITTAIWRAHRAIAYAAKQNFSAAEREYEKFLVVKNSLPEDHLSGDDLAHRVLAVSDYFIRGEIALQQGKWAEAAELLKQAVDIEDTLVYGEPPQWLQPVRHTLGAVYLKSGEYAAAERVYREDLAKWRNNGWSLYGLSRALHAQGKHEQAEEIEKQFQSIWANADEQTDTSCKCLPNA